MDDDELSLSVSLLANSFDPAWAEALASFSASEFDAFLLRELELLLFDIVADLTVNLIDKETQMCL